MKRLLPFIFLLLTASAFAYAPEPKLVFCTDTLTAADTVNNQPREDATGAAFYCTDGNGNVSSLIDASENSKAKYRYDSFSNLISKTGPLADANLTRFSGKEYHPRSGLYYYGFRYYQPNLQRWLNEDPIGLAGGLNLYGFVGNNPVDGVDPYGLWLGEWLGGQLQQAGKGLYDLMMGEDRGGHYDQNTKGALDAQMGNVDIDRNDNVLRDVLGGLGQEMGQGAGDLAEAEAGAKLLGLGGRVVCKVASKLTKPAAGVIGALSEAGAAAESSASKAASSGESVVANMADQASNCAKAAKTAGRPTTTVLSDVTVVSHGKVVGRGDVYLRPTIEGIESGSIAPRNIFRNDQSLLPSKPPGYYQEFVHPTPGVSGAGSQRIVRGAGGELYYTPDHYGSFVPLN